MEYWDIIINPPKRPKSHVGADDYVIIPQHLGDRSFQAVGDRVFSAVGKKYRLAAEVEAVGGHHRRSRSRRYWDVPLFYTVDYGNVPVIATKEDYEEPDDVSGPMLGDTLKSGQRLTPGQMLKSKNGRAVYGLQKDGNFVLYGDKVPLWNAGSGPGRNTTQVVMQTDGNLVIYDKAGNPLWASDTFGHPGARLVIQDDGNGVVYQGSVPLWSTETNGFKRYTSHSFGGDIVHAFNTVADVVGKPISLVNQALEQIPVVGDVVHAALGLDPAKALGGIAANVLQGERIDKAFLAAGKQQLKAIKEVAPYVQTVMTFVPGVGNGVAAAIAAGTALAEGRTISDAVLEGVKGAVPGGALGRTAVGAALAITHGNSITNVVADAVKAQLPPAARQAVDSAIAASHGKNVREAILQGIRANLPDSAKKALDIGVALGTARNAQSSAANALASPQGIARMAAKGVPPILRQAEPHDSDMRKGFAAAVGAIQHRGVTPVALAGMRTKLSPKEKAGFDAGVKAVVNHFYGGRHTSLVRGGIVTRGNWRPAKKGEKGIPGRLVAGKSVTHGHFVRV